MNTYKNMDNYRLRNLLLKLTVLFSIFYLFSSNPLITVYSSNERYIQDTLDDFNLAVKSLKNENIDLSSYEITINKNDTDAFRKGKIFNFLARNPIYIPFDFNGTISNSNVILSNFDKENIFQLDLQFNYTIAVNGKNQSGLGVGRYVVSLFKFVKSFDLSTPDYVMKPDMSINFKYYDLNLIPSSVDTVDLEKFLRIELIENQILSKIGQIVGENVDQSIESFFNKNVIQFIPVRLNNRKGIPFTFSITPLKAPQAINISVSQGQQLYLDGRAYDDQGKQIQDLDYTTSQTPVMRNPFDYKIKTPRQIFLSYKLFADLLKVDFIKTGEISVFEDKVDLSTVPFRFNVLYLNKFIPGLNQVYSNAQKIFVEIKIKNIEYKYGDNISEETPLYESFVIVKSDLYFKTAETQAGEVILDISLETKAFLDIERSINKNNFNIKFSENINIVQCIVKKFVGNDFRLDSFVEEFKRSYSITNIGKFDYKLFEYPIMLKDLISENHEIKKHLKGIILYEVSAPSIKNQKVLKFLN